LAPVVEDVPVRVGKRVGHVDFELLCPRLITKDTGVGQTLRWTVGCFHLAAMKCPLLEIKRAARVKREAVGCVVRVRGVETIQESYTEIGLAAAGGVFQEQ